jgi:hypothetical protein
MLEVRTRRRCIALDFSLSFLRLKLGELGPTQRLCGSPRGYHWPVQRLCYQDAKAKSHARCRGPVSSLDSNGTILRNELGLELDYLLNNKWNVVKQNVLWS